jgi:hypothetical protein
MKKPALLAVVIICLIVFVASLSAGIILTFRTVGWSSLLDSSQLQVRLKNIAGSLQDLGIGARQSLTIDETRTADLTDIRTIQITAVSERITLTSGGSQATARLSGSYRTMGSPITWVVEQKGTELQIHPDYPRWGLADNDLTMQIQIPVTFSGEVRVKTVSGDCKLPDLADYGWSLFQFNGVSGRLDIARTSMKKFEFTNISGMVDLADCTSQVSGNTVSGQVNLMWLAFNGATIKTVSGHVQLFLPTTADCLLSFKTVSGNYQNSNLPIQITTQVKRRLEGTLNQGKTPLTVETVSGDLIMSGY